MGNTANIVFCFGPRLELKTEVWAQAEQNDKISVYGLCDCWWLEVNPGRPGHLAGPGQGLVAGEGHHVLIRR